MTFTFLKLRMDGQEHELSNFELDNDNRTIMFDFDETVSVQIDDIQDLFNKEIHMLKVGHDDEYTKARIDSVYVEDGSKDNKILSLSF